MNSCGTFGFLFLLYFSYVQTVSNPDIIAPQYKILIK